MTLDLVLLLTRSEATEVRASGLPVLSSHLDIANARVEFANGAVALATASRVGPERDRRLRLFQPNGYFSLDLALGRRRFMRVRNGWQPGTGRGWTTGGAHRARAPEADALALELGKASSMQCAASARSSSAGKAAVRHSPSRSGLPMPSAPRPSPAPPRIDGSGEHARIFISAGEPSGDLHGAGVVRALLRRYPEASVEALGGLHMGQAGATLRYQMEGLAAFGLVEVVTELRTHYRLLRSLQHDFRSGRYDLAILVDYPGFHVRVAEAAHRAGTKVLHYIAPQLWAWRPGRARRFAAAVDRLAVVLPFEQEFFGGLGLRSEYVGHPLVDRGPWPTTATGTGTVGNFPGCQSTGPLSGEPGPGNPPALGALSRCGAAAGS